MKEKMILAVTLLLLTVPMISAAAEPPKKTTVIYEVDPAYEVVIPTSMDVSYQATESVYGKIRVENALLEADKCILVTMDSDGVLKNEAHPDAVIPYQILADGKPFTKQTYTKTGEETKLVVSIAPEDWKKAAGGSYKTAITFTISYVNRQ